MTPCTSIGRVRAVVVARGPGPGVDASADGSRSPATTGDALADRMASELTDREPGWRLPRRSAFAKRYGVAIGDIDAAIADLVRRSLIRRLPDGQLYRASPARHWIPVEGTEGLATRLDPMGNTISCQTRQVSRGEAPPEVRDALGQPPGSDLRIVRCVWTADDDPVAVSAAYLPGLAGDDEDDIALGSLRAVSVRVEVTPPRPEAARALGAPTGQPLITALVTFGSAADGGPAAVTVVTLKPELFRVAIDLTPARPEQH